MEYNSQFINLTKMIAKMRSFKEVGYSRLAKAMLAQAIMESGRGESTLAKEHKNFWGMKYREELKGLAKKEYVKVTSEASGGAYFCSFRTLEDAIVGYWRFMDRSPYKGWRAHAGSPESFLKFIGPIWCPPGYTDKYKKEHYGLTYDEYIIEKLFPEAQYLLNEYAYVPPEERATWFEQYRNPKGETVVVAADKEGKAVALLTSNDKRIISGFFDQFPNAHDVRIAPAGKQIPYLPGYTRGEPVVKREPVLIDPGHSEKHPGAKSQYNPSIQEENLNRMQADYLMKAWSQSAIIDPEVYDPEDDDLEEIGYRAKGKSAFISLHHNSAEGISRDAGVEVFVDKDKGSDVSFELATILSARIAAALGLRDRGAKRANLTVIDRAERVCDGPCVLVETNFINIAKNYEEQVEKSIKAAKVIAETVPEWFIKRAQKTS